MFPLESLPTVIGTAAIAPALLVLWLVIVAEDHPVSPARVWSAFLLGSASISLLEPLRNLLTHGLPTPDNPWIAQALHSVFGVALPEETVKILVIILVSIRGRTLTNPMDTVVYGAAAGLGFAAYENLLYLLQHQEMWRSLAALRSVLTVPFHGALGIIAGAYLALAKVGTALGAHHKHRDLARLSNRALILLGPLALHSAFDFPLLTLQRNPDISNITGLVLGTTSVLIGLGSIGFAIRLVWRVGRHHVPHTPTARARLSQLRRMWALLVVGGGAGFLGLAFVLSVLHRWFLASDHDAAAILVPFALASIVVGGSLLVLTTLIYMLGRHRLRRISDSFSSLLGEG